MPGQHSPLHLPVKRGRRQGVHLFGRPNSCAEHLCWQRSLPHHLQWAGRPGLWPCQVLLGQGWTSDVWSGFWEHLWYTWYLIYLWYQAFEITWRDRLDNRGKCDRCQQSQAPRVEGEAVQHHATESLRQGGSFYLSLKSNNWSSGFLQVQRLAWRGRDQRVRQLQDGVVDLHCRQQGGAGQVHRLPWQRLPRVHQLFLGHFHLLCLCCVRYKAGTGIFPSLCSLRKEHLLSQRSTVGWQQVFHDSCHKGQPGSVP